MAGTHQGFPYAGTVYDQVAVLVGDGDPVVRTARALPGLQVELGAREARLSYRDGGVGFDLRFTAVRHTPRFEGDPAQLGDLFLGHGAPADGSPGFVYEPYDLGQLTGGTLSIRGRAVPLAVVRGQGEAGQIQAPDDRRFESAYDYVAAASRDYTYVGFAARALHSGDDGVLDSYFRETASDEFTLEAGALAEGNVHGAPAAYDNTRPALAKLGQWAVDLGPGVLFRKLVRGRDRDGRPVMALSETIREARLDAVAPVIGGVRLARRRCRVSFRLSEAALVTVRGARLDLPAGRHALRLGRPGRVTLRATDEAGNRSRGVRLRCA